MLRALLKILGGKNGVGEAKANENHEPPLHQHRLPEDGDGSKQE